MMKLIGCTLAMASVLVAGCTSQPQGDSIPEDVQNAWVAAFNSANRQGLTEIYTEDCVLLPPNGEVSKGRDAVLAIFGVGMDQGFKATQENQEIKVEGNTAYRYGTYTLADAQGQPLDRGKYVEIWRKENGMWKMSHDIWNSSNPAPAPQQTPTSADASTPSQTPASNQTATPVQSATP